MNLGNRLPLSAEINFALQVDHGIFMKIKLNKFVIEGLVFELWHHVSVQLPSETKLSTALYTLQLEGLICNKTFAAP